MDNGVYADLEMLVAWKNEMETMNDSAVQVLDTLKGTIADLEKQKMNVSADFSYATENESVFEAKENEVPETKYKFLGISTISGFSAVPKLTVFISFTLSQYLIKLWK